MLRITKRYAKRVLMAGALVAAAGLTTLGGASEAEARGCGPRGFGYGYGGGGFYGRGVGFAPRAVVVGRPVVAAPIYGRGFYGGNPHWAGYRGGFYGGRGVSVSFGF